LRDEWSFGIPVIEHAVARKEVQRADDVLSRTMASLFRGSGVDRPLSPETELIEDRLIFRAGVDKGNVVKLLSLAVIVSKSIGDGARESRKGARVCIPRSLLLRLSW
jgi:hypothetical protein